MVGFAAAFKTAAAGNGKERQGGSGFCGDRFDFFAVFGFKGDQHLILLPGTGRKRIDRTQETEIKTVQAA
jgi:hypothetical protein